MFVITRISFHNTKSHREIVLIIVLIHPLILMYTPKMLYPLFFLFPFLFLDVE